MAFDLVAEAQALSHRQFALWMLIGAAVFLAGDWYIEKKFGGDVVGGLLG